MLRYLGDTKQSDYPATLAGNFALISYGECSFQLKAALSVAAGAVGTIIFDDFDDILQDTLEEQGDYTPTVGISKADGLKLIAALEAGIVQATKLSVEFDKVKRQRTMIFSFAR